MFCSGFIARGKEELPKRDDLTERHTLSFFFSTRSESFSRFRKLWDTSLVIPRLPSCTHAIQLKAAKNRRCLLALVCTVQQPMRTIAFLILPNCNICVVTIECLAFSH